MSNRTKIIILISAGTIIVIALLFVIKYIHEQNFPKKTPVETPLITAPKTEEQTFVPSEISPLTEEVKEKIKLEKMVFNFIETFGSYSNQSDFQNIVSLKNFATSKAQNFIDNFINQEKIKNKISNEYYGITTKALTVKNINLKETQAEFLINTQRQEAKKSTQNIKVFYQDILIKLIKQGDDWKVDGVEWGK